MIMIMIDDIMNNQLNLYLIGIRRVSRNTSRNADPDPDIEEIEFNTLLSSSSPTANPILTSPRDS